MEIDIIDIDKFVEANNCPRVSNVASFAGDGLPTADGLFSYELFGMDSEARKNIFGYIELGRPFIHPAVYAVMRARMGNIKKILSGEMYGSLSPFGEIIVTKEPTNDSGTGVDFFYDNFSKINWIKAKNISSNADDEAEDESDEDAVGSLDKATRLRLLSKLKKEEFFCTKWLVIPPGYRDISPDAATMGDDINKLYKKLLGYSRSMAGGSIFNFTGFRTQVAVQNTLFELFMATTKLIRGKDTIFRQYVLGKDIDFSASSVITAYDYSADKKPTDMRVNLGYGEFPLSSVLSMFHPIVSNHIIYKLNSVYDTCLKSYTDTKYDKNKITPKLASDLIKMYIKSPELRFDYFALDAEQADGTRIKAKIPVMRQIQLDSGEWQPVSDFLTIADLLFACAKESTVGLHAYVTRYPVENFQNIYPSRININCTSKRCGCVVYLVASDGNTETVFSDGVITEHGKELYKEYPCVLTPATKQYVKPSDAKFVDVFKPGSIVLKSLDGDYDGDVLFMKGLFSKEANEEAERLIQAKTNVFLGNSKVARSITGMGMEVQLSLYEFTKL